MKLSPQSYLHPLRWMQDGDWLFSSDSIEFNFFCNVIIGCSVVDMMKRHIMFCDTQSDLLMQSEWFAIFSDPISLMKTMFFCCKYLLYFFVRVCTSEEWGSLLPYVYKSELLCWFEDMHYHLTSFFLSLFFILFHCNQWWIKSSIFNDNPVIINH